MNLNSIAITPFAQGIIKVDCEPGEEQGSVKTRPSMVVRARHHEAMEEESGHRTQPELAEHAIHAKLLERPANREAGAVVEIPVRMFFNKAGNSIAIHYKAYDLETGAPVCTGDGKSAARVTVAGDSTQSLSQVPCPGAERCAFAQLADDSYQLIAGGRRFKAVVAEFGPEALIKAEVSVMSDAEATAAMLAENNEREDPSVIEDAEGAMRMLGLCKGDREEAARRLGWGRNKLDRRLAVMNATQEVRDAYLEDKILVGHVEILAALRKEVQANVLAKLLAAQGKITVEQLKAAAEQSLLSLEAAIFDRADCTGCQYNTGMQQSMFETSFSGSRCTNKECYSDKTEDELQKRVKALADTYQVVRIVRPGENATLQPVRADGVKGLGEEQAGHAHLLGTVSYKPKAKKQRTGRPASTRAVKRWLKTNGKHPQAPCVSAALDVHAALTKKGAPEFGFFQDEYSADMESIGAMCFLAWDDPHLLWETAAHAEENSYNAGDVVEAYARKTLPLKDGVTDRQLAGLVVQLKDYLNAWHLLERLMSHLADTAFDPKSDLEEVKDETVQLAEELINRLGNARVKGKKPTKDERKADIAKPAPVAKAKDSELQKTQAQPVAKQPAKPAAPSKTTSVEKPKGMESKVFAPTPTVGITYVGVLKQSGSHRMTPRDREPYEVFQATILLDNGAELPLRGAELERELDAAGCQVGERVSITPMGKVPVTLAGGREGSKNLYKVENLMVSA